MNWKVQRVAALMQHDLHRSLSLSELSRCVNLSPSRLQHLFRAETGTSLMRHLQSLRMKKAQALLETTLLSVKEIMLRVGVKDRSHFERDFKRIYGLTPTQYRATVMLILSAEEYELSK
jgi:transcriptional regulator GlxA family with amidase domain